MDDDVLLNLAGTDPTEPFVERQKRPRPGSRRERQQKRAADSQAEALRKKFGKEQPRDKARRTAALKGYSLQSPAAAKGAGAEQTPRQQPSRKRQRTAPPARGAVEKPAASQPGGDGGEEEAAAGEEPVVKPAAAEKPVLADVLSAVAANRKRDARVGGGLGETAPGHDRHTRPFMESEDEEEAALGRVSFVDERRPLRPAQRRPRLPEEAPQGRAGDKPKKQRFAKGAGAVQPKRGELAHAVRAVLPQQEQEAVFGPGDAAGDDATFGGLGLAASLAAHLAELKFTAPTRVQRAAIPALLAGRDALVNAPTGSGKTLAYLAPIIHDLQGREPRVTRELGTLALLVLPTRELCLQVADVLALVLKRYHWLVGGAVFGGEKRAGEKARLRRGVAVLAGTPGRLLDHLQNTASFTTANLKRRCLEKGGAGSPAEPAAFGPAKRRWLVLDEADRLLDQGFQAKIEQMLRELAKRSADSAPRQSVMLSATLHAKLGALASLSLRDPQAIGFSLSSGAGGQLSLAAAEGEQAGGSGGEGALAERRGSGRAASTSERGEGTGAGDQQFVIPAQLRQSYLEVPTKHRLAALAGLLRHFTARPDARVVVFFSTCDGVEFHHAALATAAEEVLGEPLLEDCKAFKLHGNLPQGERTKAFLHFMRSARSVLLCTDVAARGLDFPAVTAILQFDPPGEPSEYVHRVGRTARMGQAGEALLVLLPSERAYLARLAGLGIHLAPLPLREALRGLQRAPLGAGQAPGRQAMRTSEAAPEPSVPSALLALSGALVGAVGANPAMETLAAAAFRAHVRSYATHSAALKDIFHIRRLHLGHLAHAFGLRASPCMTGQSLTKAEKLRDRAKGGPKRKLKPFKAGPLAGKLPLRGGKGKGKGKGGGKGGRPLLAKAGRQQQKARTS